MQATGRSNWLSSSHWSLLSSHGVCVTQIIYPSLSSSSVENNSAYDCSSSQISQPSNPIAFIFHFHHSFYSTLVIRDLTNYLKYSIKLVPCWVASKLGLINSDGKKIDKFIYFYACTICPRELQLRGFFFFLFIIH